MLDPFEIRDLSAVDRAFQQEVREFYETNLTPEMRRAGKMVTLSFSEFEFGKRWQQILHRKGWGAPYWPVEYGGTGWNSRQRMIWEIETARADPPAVLAMGLTLCAPCIMQFGTLEQKEYFLPRILSGEDFWAQGYSEPGAGSDLSAIQFRAISDGEDYVLNGSKIWTTFAHHANRVFCLVRTAVGSRKQAGISFLLVDMDSPGIEVRPIINIAGDHEFNQVFFTNVRVPKSRRLGGENEGWAVARQLLRFEHGGSWRASAELRKRLALLVEIATIEADGSGGCLIDDCDFSRSLAEAAIAVEAVEYATERVFSMLKPGEAPPPTVPLLRLRGRDLCQRLTELSMEATAYYGAPFQKQARTVAGASEHVGPDHALLTMAVYLSQRGITIAGGTPDIQRNNLVKEFLR